MTIVVVVPTIRGPSVTVFEDKGPATVCVNLEDSTTTISESIMVTFTPVAKSGAGAATRE